MTVTLTLIAVANLALFAAIIFRVARLERARQRNRLAIRRLHTYMAQLPPR